jgi:hypothetical protein
MPVVLQSLREDPRASDVVEWVMAQMERTAGHVHA